MLQPPQGAPRADGCRAWVRLAERVVEDLQRDGSVIAGAHEVTHEGAEVEAAFAWEEAVVPTPREHIHGEERARPPAGRRRSCRPGSSRSLPGCGPSTGCGSCRGTSRRVRGRRAARCERQPRSCRRIGPMRAPHRRRARRTARRGRRAARSWAAASCSSPLRAVATLLHSSMVSMPRRFMSANFAAARRRFCSRRSGPTPSKSRKGWYRSSDRPSSLGPRPDRLGRVGRGDEVGLEDLHSIETRLARGDELLIERAAEADRGDRRAHGAFLRAPALVPAQFSEQHCMDTY